MYHVDQCLCGGHTFEELKALAAANHWDFEELRRRTGCGLGCGLCIPYLRAMLKTGQTEFSEIIRDGAEAPAGSSSRSPGRERRRTATVRSLPVLDSRHCA